MPRTPASLDRDIQAALGLPAAVIKRWRTKVAAYRKAVRELEGGYSDAGVMKLAKARDALDTAIWDASAHIPYSPDQKPHLSPPIVELQRERDELVRGTYTQAQAAGREANERASRAELKRIDAEIRERDRPYDWMRR